MASPASHNHPLFDKWPVLHLTITHCLTTNGQSCISQSPTVWRQMASPASHNHPLFDDKWPVLHLNHPLFDKWSVLHLVITQWQMASPASHNHLLFDKWPVLHLITVNAISWQQNGKHHLKLYVKLQALVYDILPSTTAVFSYAIGSRKLSANEQFFVGAQTVVTLLQTTQIKQGMSFIAANKVYISTNKTTIVWIETELFFFSFFTRGGCVSCLRACFGARLSAVILVPESFGGRWTAVRR